MIALITIAISCVKQQTVPQTSVASATSSHHTRTGSERIFSSVYSNVTINGMTYEQGLNYIGQLHNDYLQTLLTQLYNERFSISNKTDFENNVRAKTVAFFASKDITVPSSFSIQNYSQGIREIDLSNCACSASGLQILTELKTIISNPNLVINSALFASLEDLKQRAMSLSSENDVYTVGVPITVAIYSYSYWNTNADTWNTKFEYLNPSGKPKINLWELGFADCHGAYAGGMGGVVLGPGGAAAGAILGAAGESLFDLFGQIAWGW